MEREEKIFMVQCLLEDVRGNWGENVEERVTEAKDLCLELGGDFETLAKRCDEFLDMDSINRDGRFFRDIFPDGYEEMDKLHSLPRTLSDKSAEFKRCAELYLTYPEHRFDDYEERDF